MPIARKRKRYHHGDLRRALLDATLDLAAEHGAGGVTLREVARSAGVSQTAPYRHFPDKDAMLAAAAEEGFRLYHDELEAALSATRSDPKARLVELGVTYVRFAIEHTPYFRLMYGHGSPPKSASPELQAAARVAFQAGLAVVEQALAHASSKASVKDVMFRMWALIHGIATLALDRQILFDINIDALLRATRAAVADLFASVVH